MISAPAGLQYICKHGKVKAAGAAEQACSGAGAASAVHVQLTCRLGSASTGRLPRPGPAQPGPGPRRLPPGSELLCSQLSQSSQLGLHGTPCHVVYSST